MSLLYFYIEMLNAHRNNQLIYLYSFQLAGQADFYVIYIFK